MFMYVLCIYKKPIILSLYKADNTKKAYYFCDRHRLFQATLRL